MLPLKDFEPFLCSFETNTMIEIACLHNLVKKHSVFERKVSFCSCCELILAMEILVIYPAAFQFYSIHSFTRMLQEDPVLFQLYKDLVVSQVISAEEFWANRLSLNAGDNSAAPSKQDVGISAAFLVCWTSHWKRFRANKLGKWEFCSCTLFPYTWMFFSPGTSI